MPPGRNSFVIFGPADIREEFAREATVAGFTAQNRPIHQLSVGPQNAAEILQVVFSKEGLAFFTALAGVVIAFLKKGPSRRITITKIEHDRALAIDASGLTKKQLANLLSESREMIVYDKRIRSRRLRNSLKNFSASGG